MRKTIAEEHLYQQVADRLEKMIAEDLLRIGEKLPSVRRLSQEQGISISTAFQAYYQLERKGLIEARPKSGYYVRYNPTRFPAMPSILEKEHREEQVTVAEMIATVYRNVRAEGVTRFSVAAPALELLPAAKLDKALLQAIRSSDHHCLGYEEVQGNPALRKQLARLAFNWGGMVQADEVVVTAGCMEALVMCLKAVTRPGDTVAIESPTYFGIFQVLHSLGLQIVEIRSDPADGLDLDHLARVLQTQRVDACLFVPNFSNPGGSCMSDVRKKELVQLLASREIPLIEDDIYGDLYFGKSRPRTCKSFDQKGLVLYCSSLSKSLAPGYRIGWTIPGRFRSAVVNHKMIYTVATNSPTQAAIAFFLEKGRYDFHLKKLRKSLHTQCLRYMQAITAYFPEAIRVSRPQGGFVLWIELPATIDSFELYQAAIREKISIAREAFFSTNQAFSHYIRLGFGTPYSPAIEESLKTLGQLIHKMG